MTPAPAPWRDWPKGQLIRIPDLRGEGCVRKVWFSERFSDDVVTVDLANGGATAEYAEKVVKVEAVNG